MNLLIVGSGRCVWDDLAKVDLPEDIMAVNDMIVHFPYKLKYAYSLNREMLKNWVALRKDSPIQLSNRKPKIKSSGVNAVFCGLDLGYEKITVCGIPFDNSGHYFEPPWIKTAFERHEIIKFDERVTFVSGRLCSWS